MSTSLRRDAIRSLIFAAVFASAARIPVPVFSSQPPDSKYDFGTTIFSPKGRIYQVEYASEAVNRAQPAVGICTDEGVVLCSLKTIYNNHLQVENQREKTSRIDEHVVCACVGVISDAMVLVKDARVTAQQHSLTFQEPIPMQKLATHIADVKQAYTQHGGLRPHGVSILWAGWDISRGIQLYKTDPSGNFEAFKAVAVGANSAEISASIVSSYHAAGGSEMGLAEAVRIAARVLGQERARKMSEHIGAGKKMDNNIMPPAGIGMEIATIAVDEGSGGSASAYIYNDAEIDSVLRRVGCTELGGARVEKVDTDVSGTGDVTPGTESRR